VADSDRFEFHRTGVPNTYRVLVRFGYADHVLTASMKDFTGPLRVWLTMDLHRHREGSAEFQRVEEELRNLSVAVERERVSFVMDKSELKAASRNWVVRILHAAFCFMRDNTRSRPSYWHVPADKLVELGGIRYI
jgi:KUP system potassium uptake protein